MDQRTWGLYAFFRWNYLFCSPVLGCSGWTVLTQLLLCMVYCYISISSNNQCYFMCFCYVLQSSHVACGQHKQVSRLTSEPATLWSDSVLWIAHTYFEDNTRVFIHRSGLQSAGKKIPWNYPTWWWCFCGVLNLHLACSQYVIITFSCFRVWCFKGS